MWRKLVTIVTERQNLGLCCEISGKILSVSLRQGEIAHEHIADVRLSNPVSQEMCDLSAFIMHGSRIAGCENRVSKHT